MDTTPTIEPAPGNSAPSPEPETMPRPNPPLDTISILCEKLALVESQLAGVRITLDRLDRRMTAEPAAAPAVMPAAVLSEAVRRYQDGQREDKELLALTARWHDLVARHRLSESGETLELCTEIEAVEGQLLRRKPETANGAAHMLSVAHRIAATQEADSGTWLGGDAPVAGLIARVAGAMDEIGEELCFALAENAKRA